MQDRSAWRKEKRQSTEDRMDTLFAPIYDENWGTEISPTHRHFIELFLGACQPGASVLDAACGTGKYWSMLLSGGIHLTGIDQSLGMLQRSISKYPLIPVKKLGLQEMQFMDEFDGITCVDAMEYVFPEDWPLVLENFYRALKFPGILYFTVEIANSDEIEKSYRAGKDLGLPVLPGEWAHEEGYHYYPDMGQVRTWIDAAHFSILHEAVGDEYHHFLMQRA